MDTLTRLAVEVGQESTNERLGQMQEELRNGNGIGGWSWVSGSCRLMTEITVKVARRRYHQEQKKIMWTPRKKILEKFFP